MLQITVHVQVQAGQYEGTYNLAYQEESLRGGHYHICGAFVVDGHGLLGWNW